MSKQCSGKYHGSGIKYINDNETYCKICKQNMDCNKKKTWEVAGGILIGVLSVAAAILGVNSKRAKK